MHWSLFYAVVLLAALFSVSLISAATKQCAFIIIIRSAGMCVHTFKLHKIRWDYRLSWGNRVHFIVISKCIHFSIKLYLNGVARATHVGTLNRLLIEEWDASNWRTWLATWAEIIQNSLMPCAYNGLLYAVRRQFRHGCLYNSLESGETRSVFNVLRVHH